MAFKVHTSIVCDTPNCKNEIVCTAVGYNHIPRGQSVHEAEDAGWYIRNAFANCPSCASKLVNDLVGQVQADNPGRVAAVD